MNRWIGNIVWAVFLVVILSPVAALAQEQGVASDSPVDTELLSFKLAEVETSKTLDETLAQTLTDLYRRTLSNLERAETQKNRAARYVEAGASAPTELKEVLQSLERLRSEPTGSPALQEASLSEDALQLRVAQQKEQLGRAETRLYEVRDQLANEASRPAEARQRLVTARKELGTYSAELEAEPPPGEATDITQARRWHLQARIYRLTAEIRKLDQELLTHQPRFQLYEAQQQLAAAEVERDRLALQQSEAALSDLRNSAAEQALAAAELARRELSDQPVAVSALAAGNVELGDVLAQRILGLQEASGQRDMVRQQAAEFREDLASLKSKLAIAGLNRALGQLLVDQQRALPSSRVLQKQIKQRELQAGEVGLEQISLAEQLRELQDIEAYLDRLAADITDADATALRPKLQQLANDRYELLEQSSQTGSRYLRILGELDLAQRDLLETVREFDAFLAKRLLWVRSEPPLNVAALSSIPRDLAQLFSVSAWAESIADLGRSLFNNPIAIIVILLVAALGLMRARWLAGVDASSRYSGRIRDDRMRYSIQALVFTVLAAVPFPLLLIVTGYMMTAHVGLTTFSHALGETLVVVGADLLVIQFFIEACRPKGLAVSHCGWSSAVADQLARELRWFRFVFPLSRVVGKTSLLLGDGGPVGGLAILGLVIAAGSVAVLVYRLLTPGGGILRHRMSQNADGWLTRWQPLLSLLFVAAIPVLIIVWLAGFNYMGEVIAESFLRSFWLVLWLILLHGLLGRWLMLSYQRLELNAAIARRDAARAARRAASEAPEEQQSATAQELELEEDTVDFAELNSDSRSLLGTIVLLVTLFWLWLIWAPIIPALGTFDNLTLWTRAGEIGGEAARLPVTVLDLLIAVVIAIITAAAARGLPSLTELFMLRSGRLTAGERYTVITLSRYLIIGIGAVLVIGRLGVDWSKVQWLVAALGVGIGFGLQEIVANFISGLIILFERPIRVGDTVTVGETSGVVTRIRIRATTIRDWDRRELLVPNREFISNRLLNWSLSDNVIRLLLPVGVSYDSDVVQAMKLAEEAAREHESVLDDPKPFVIFEGFGDNALQISLRAYLDSIDDRITVTSELNVAIGEKFRDAGITIAYPQRDLHLDSSRPLEIRMVPASGSADGDRSPAET